MLVSIDLETHLIDRCNLAPEIVCAGLQWGPGLWGGRLGRVFEVERAVPVIVEALQSTDVTILGANFAFDAACLCAHDDELIPIVFDAYRAGKIRDVLLQEKMVDIAIGEEHDSYSLASVAKRRLGRALDKECYWRLHFSELDGMRAEDYPQEALDYVLDDIQIPLDLESSQQADSNRWAAKYGTGLFAQSPQEAYAAFTFYLASCWGVRTDPSRVGALALALKQRLDRAKGRLVKVGLVQGPTKLRKRRGGGTEIVANPGYGTRIVKAATALIAQRWEKLGVVEPKLTVKGALSLDKDACTLSGSRVLELYSDYSQTTSTMSRVKDLAQGVELPLQASFDTLLNTNRTSSYKPKPPVVGIQLQNFGRKDGTRACLRPRDGCVFAIADVASMELHFIAQFCLDMGFGSRLAEMLNSGIDVHWMLAAVSLGISYEQIRADEPRYEADRQRIKPMNFGPWGGMREAKIVLYSRAQFGVLYTLAEAKHLYGAWQEMLPESRQFFAYLSKACRRRDGKGTLCHPRTGVWRTAHYPSLANWAFQHPSAIGVKLGLAEAQHEAYACPSSPLYDSRMVNAVHDEGVSEVEESRAAEVADRLGELIAKGCNSLLPDVPTRCVSLIARTWEKHHKPRRDANGRLVLS